MKMKLKWRDFEFEIRRRKDLDYVIEFITKIKKAEDVDNEYELSLSNKALEYLLKNREVYIISSQKLKDFAFVRKNRSKIIVKVRYVGEIVLTAPDDEWYVCNRAYMVTKLEEFVDKSGFDTIEEWLEDVKKLNGGRLPDRMLLYNIILA